MGFLINFKKTEKTRYTDNPLEVYNEKKQLMQKNEKFLYSDEGKLDQINTHGGIAGATAMYAFDNIVTSKG